MLAERRRAGLNGHVWRLAPTDDPTPCISVASQARRDDPAPCISVALSRRMARHGKREDTTCVLCMRTFIHASPLLSRRLSSIQLSVSYKTRATFKDKSFCLTFTVKHPPYLSTSKPTQFNQIPSPSLASDHAPLLIAHSLSPAPLLIVPVPHIRPCRRRRRSLPPPPLARSDWIENERFPIVVPIVVVVECSGIEGARRVVRRWTSSPSI